MQRSGTQWDPVNAAVGSGKRLSLGTGRYAAVQVRGITWHCCSRCVQTAAIGTCFNAAQEGHLSVLRWAHSNSCPRDLTACVTEGSNDDVMVWCWEITEAGSGNRSV